jgi:thiol-disulfide isomerase/thioredoxin
VRILARAPLAIAVLLLALTSVAAAQEAWLDHPLQDVATGETFALRDLAGTPVLVETMATWCGNCRRQLGNLSEAKARLDADGVDVAYVVVSVERGLDPAALAAYAQRHGFAFRFAVADDALLQMLAGRFGRIALNPPATPHVLIGADGTVGELTTGFSPPDALVERLAAAAAP